MDGCGKSGQKSAHPRVPTQTNLNYCVITAAEYFTYDVFLKTGFAIETYDQLDKVSLWPIRNGPVLGKRKLFDLSVDHRGSVATDYDTLYPGWQALPGSDPRLRPGEVTRKRLGFLAQTAKVQNAAFRELEAGVRDIFNMGIDRATYELSSERRKSETKLLEQWLREHYKPDWEKELPLPRTVDASYLQSISRILGQPVPDEWGTRIRFDVEKHRLISAGPDRSFGTHDDMVEQKAM